MIFKNKYINDFLNYGCFIALPALNKIWILTNFESYEKNDEHKFAFYKNNFFLTEKFPWLRAKNHYEADLNEFKKLIFNFKKERPFIKWEIANKLKYKQQFDSLQLEINKGNLIKGVPFTHQISNSIINQEQLVYLLDRLLNYEKNNDLYLYGFWNLAQKQGFMGASPELLFTQNSNYIETYALAGTISNKEINNKINNKIILEHNFVLDGIKENLRKFGEINTEKTVLLELEKFSHLKSALILKLKNIFNFEDILAAIHPTPALGAFPQKIGLSWLQKIENKIEKRYDYCSPFGICIDKNFSLCIGIIRCLQWHNNSLKITAGGGVIKESIFEDEWEEICMKIEAVKNYFNL